MQKMEPLPAVALDENACKACRSNTDKKMSAEGEVEKGGNAQEYQAILGKTAETEECTQIGWNGSALELIINTLIEGWTANQKHVIFEHKVTKVGVSFKADKKVQNIFQVLYVKQDTNQMA